MSDDPTLTEFLLARIAEDAAFARRVAEAEDAMYRSLAAANYADHPDYRQEWAL